MERPYRMAFFCLLLVPQVANAQLASQRPPSRPPTVADETLRPVLRSKDQDGDLGAEPLGISLEVANTTQLIRTLAGPAAGKKHSVVRCDPRTLAESDASLSQFTTSPRSHTLNIGKQGQAVVADTIYFVGTSDGTQCPALGKSVPLPSYLLDLIP